MNANQMLLTLQSIETQMEGLRQQKRDLNERLTKVLTRTPVGAHVRVNDGEMRVTGSFAMPDLYQTPPKVQLVLSGKLLRKDGTVGVKGASSYQQFTTEELNQFSE